MSGCKVFCEFELDLLTHLRAAYCTVLEKDDELKEVAPLSPCPGWCVISCDAGSAPNRDAACRDSGDAATKGAAARPAPLEKRSKLDAYEAASGAVRRGADAARAAPGAAR
jgi:hypothetical protein